jgi:DNA-binding transcriptional LysR family regulator
MNYTLNQLNIFLKVAQLNSITKAAEELHLSQPAVSIQLRNFQDQFDLPLTEVVGRKLYVTEFGREIAQTAEQILDGVRALDYKTHAHKGQIGGKLRISAVSTGKYVMPYFLTDFLKEHQGIDLYMDVTNRARVLEALVRNEVDYALVSLLPDTPSVDYLELMQNKLYLVLGQGWGLYDGAYDNSVLEQLPVIFREQGSATRVAMERYINAHGIQVRKKIELTSNEAVKQATIAGLGCSIMPLIGLRNELGNGQLQIVSLNQFPIVTNWYLVWLKGKRFSAAAAAYMSYVRAEKDNIIRGKFDWFEQYQ